MAGPARNTSPPPSKHQVEEKIGLLCPPSSQRSGCDAPGSQDPEIQACAARESDRPTSPRIRKSTEGYIQDLLEFIAQGGKDYRSLSDLIHSAGIDSNPCLLRDGDVIYSLLPDVTALASDETANETNKIEECLFFRLDYDANGIKQSVDLGTQAHYFLALGWLVEHNIKTKERRTSNYALCLNVTEKPMSLWLVFDYPESNDGADDPYRETSFGNLYNTIQYPFYYKGPDHLLGKPSKYDRINSNPAFPQGLIQSFKQFDLAKVSDDVCGDWIGHANGGLNPSKVYDRMQRTLTDHEGTLRAVEAWPEDATN